MKNIIIKILLMMPILALSSEEPKINQLLNKKVSCTGYIEEGGDKFYYKINGVVLQESGTNLWIEGFSPVKKKVLIHIINKKSCLVKIVRKKQKKVAVKDVITNPDKKTLEDNPATTKVNSGKESLVEPQKNDEFTDATDFTKTDTDNNADVKDNYATVETFENSDLELAEESKVIIEKNNKNKEYKEVPNNINSTDDGMIKHLKYIILGE